MPYDVERVLAHCREAVGFLDACTIVVGKYTTLEYATEVVARSRRVLLEPRLAFRDKWTDDRKGWTNSEVRCTERTWLSDLGVVPTMHLAPDDARDALQASLVGVRHEAREQVASVDPTRPGAPRHCLARWRETGRQSEPVSHYDVMLWAMETLRPDWTKSYCAWLDHKSMTRPPPMPDFGSDPVYPFLIVYAIKQGPAMSKSPWVLRETARR